LKLNTQITVLNKDFEILFLRLNSRLGVLDKNLDSRFEQLENRLKTRVDVFDKDSRFDQLGNRLNTQTTILDKGLESRSNQLENRLLSGLLTVRIFVFNVHNLPKSTKACTGAAFAVGGTVIVAFM
jgi:hypothetical protein